MLALLQFDAPALPRIEQMLAEGRLPTLAELRKRGRWESMDARQTVLQSSTYPTLYTGIDVRSHGLYSTFPWSAAEQRVRFMHSFPKPPTIWERLTAQGRRSLVVDPYLAWHPREMAGVYLNGWQFEDRMATQGRSVPRGRRRALSKRHGRPPRLDDVYGTHRAGSLLAWRDHLISAPSRTADAVRELLGQESFDFAWINFSASHKAGHHLWDAAAVTEEPLDDVTARTLRTGLDEVYAAVDAALGRTLEALPDDADVIVFAPTGMGPNTSLADLLPGMLNAVLTGKAQASNGRHRFRTPIWSLRSRIPVSWRSSIARTLPDSVVADLTTRLYTRADWKRTPAIALPGEHTGYIRVNLSGREREGIVDPADADELLDSIAERLLTFHNPDGTRSIDRVERRSELMGEGPCVERLPDLVVFWATCPAADVPRVSSPRYGDVERRGIGSGRSGNHTDDAWAIVAPGASRACELGRALRITDFGATACSLLEADLTGLSGEPLLAKAP